MGKDDKKLPPSERLKRWKELNDEGAFNQPTTFWEEIRQDVELGGQPIPDQPKTDAPPTDRVNPPPTKPKKGGPKPR